MTDIDTLLAPLEAEITRTEEIVKEMEQKL